jgi:hypothetical protein
LLACFALRPSFLPSFLPCLLEPLKQLTVLTVWLPSSLQRLRVFES